MAARIWARVCVLLGGLSALGCGDDERDPFMTLTADAAFPGEPGDAAAHAGLFEFQPLPGCSVANATNLSGATELRLFGGMGVTDSDVRYFTSGLQRYYSQYGITMSTRHATLPLPLDEALILDMGDLRGRVKAETGLDLDAPHTDDEEARVIASFGSAVFWNVKEIIRVYGTPRRDVVNVVILPAMVQQVPPEFAPFAGLVGLGVSPELLAAAPPNDPSRQLYDWLDVSEEFTPTVFVATSIVRERLPEPDIAIAHEVGHAYGLVHVPSSETNLMNPSPGDCSVPLDEGQLDQVAEATRAIAHGLEVESVSLTARAGEFVTAVRRYVRAQALR